MIGSFTYSFIITVESLLLVNKEEVVVQSLRIGGRESSATDTPHNRHGTRSPLTCGSGGSSYSLPCASILETVRVVVLGRENRLLGWWGKSPILGDGPFNFPFLRRGIIFSNEFSILNYPTKKTKTLMLGCLTIPSLPHILMLVTYICFYYFRGGEH